MKAVGTLRLTRALGNTLKNPTLKHLQAFLLVCQRNPVRKKEIERSFQWHNSTGSKVIKELIEADLLEAATIGNDFRHKYLILTSKGKSLRRETDMV